MGCDRRGNLNWGGWQTCSSVLIQDGAKVSRPRVSGPLHPATPQEKYSRVGEWVSCPYSIICKLLVIIIITVIIMIVIMYSFVCYFSRLENIAFLHIKLCSFTSLSLSLSLFLCCTLQLVCVVSLHQSWSLTNLMLYVATTGGLLSVGPWLIYCCLLLPLEDCSVSVWVPDQPNAACCCHWRAAKSGSLTNLMLHDAATVELLSLGPWLT